MQPKLPKPAVHKTRLVILAGIALLAIFTLALGLSQQQFQPGRPLNLGDTSQTLQFTTALSVSGLDTLMQALYAASLAACLILLVYMLLSAERRKALAKFLLRLLPFLVAAFLIIQYTRSCGSRSALQPTQPMGLGQQTPAATVPIAVFSPDLSASVILAASLLLALLAAVLITFIILRLVRSGRPDNKPLLRLADEAQAALDALDAGADLRNAVTRCYYEMNRILVTEKDLRRSRWMTAREFKTMLVAHGLPEAPTAQLTRLFEAVRYGAALPGQAEEDLARASLGAIVTACRSAR